MFGLQVAGDRVPGRPEAAVEHRATEAAPGYSVTGPEMVFGVSAFPNSDEKFSGLSSDTAAYP